MFLFILRSVFLSWRKNTASRCSGKSKDVKAGEATTEIENRIYPMDVRADIVMDSHHRHVAGLPAHPIPVLEPLPDHVFARPVEGMLQVPQSSNQALRVRRSAPLRDEARAHDRVQPISIDQIGQPHQRVLELI